RELGDHGLVRTGLRLLARIGQRRRVGTRARGRRVDVVDGGGEQTCTWRAGAGVRERDRRVVGLGGVSGGGWRAEVRDLEAGLIELSLCDVFGHGLSLLVGGVLRGAEEKDEIAKRGRRRAV